MKLELTEILKARDERYSMRMNISEKSLVSISLSLNIPGFPKSDDQITSFFVSLVKQLEIYMLSHRQCLLMKDSVLCCDADGDFFISPVVLSNISVGEFKLLCEEFEINHPLSRLIDVDVVDDEGNPVSSGKAKTCLLCKHKSAIECMREKNHSYQEIREFISNKIELYTKGEYKKYLIHKISSSATKALLHEVALSPKPGLVDRNDSGSHSDMDFSSFLNSTAVISVYFPEIIKYACNFSDDNILTALAKLRIFGLEMERDMFTETQGVNTHKGAVFLLVFSVFISSYLKYRNKYSHENFISLLKQFNKGVVDRELVNMRNKEEHTHGEKCYAKFGNKALGIRGEVENGLPIIFNFSLKVLHSNFKKLSIITDKKMNEVLTKTLLVIMSENDDTNILFRKGELILSEFKQKAKKCINAQPNDISYKELADFCTKERISPGGAADLLALTLFIYYVDIMN